MIKLKVYNLEPNMILGDDILISTGAILIPKNVKLNYGIIERIRDLNIEQVVVKKESLPKGFDPKRPHSLPAVELRNRLKAFYETSGRGEIELEPWRGGVRRLMDNILEEGDILGSIRQIKEYDEYTFEHSLKVCMLAITVGKWLNYPKRELEELAFAGLFHDIGKCKISKQIINKPGPLTDSEYEIVKKHSMYGYEIMSKVKGLSEDVPKAILQHHEREDCSGYPFRVCGSQIHEYAKIISVCDVFDAMTANRVYKKKESPFEVAEYLKRNAYGKLDARIVKLFLDNITQYFVGNEIILNTGESGKVIHLNQNNFNKPIVKVEDKFINLMNSVDLRIVDVKE